MAPRPNERTPKALESLLVARSKYSTRLTTRLSFVPDDALAYSPPRRSREMLRVWVQEFIDQGHLVASDVRVVHQEDTGGRDTGLVVVGLEHAGGSIHLEPVGYDEPLWQVTVSLDDGDATMPPYALASLAAELVVAGNLCTFLQWKSLEWDRNSGRHGVA